MKQFFILTLVLVALTSCTTQPTQLAPTSTGAALPLSLDTPAASNTPQANMPNPASSYCERQGNRVEIRTAADGSQSGVCIFPDGSECDEWAYFRGECVPDSQKIDPTPVEAATPTPAKGEFPTPMPIDPEDYQGWWTYTHSVYKFSIQLPEDWRIEETTTFDPVMNGHTINLHPKYTLVKENIRITFRRLGEDAKLWPTGVGQGEFIPQGTLDVAGQPARRVLLVCPTGEVTAIWYYEGTGQDVMTRGELQFGFIFTAGDHCEAGASLSGKVQRAGEMIISSLKVP